jgi:transcription-repair coupling factor (superfamily II helicase)
MRALREETWALGRLWIVALLSLHLLAVKASRIAGLLTDTIRGRLQIKGDRFVFPGDYVVHREYGIGKYLGVSMLDTTPTMPTRSWTPLTVVQYNDSILSWYSSVASSSLWLYRSASPTTSYELSPALDTRKWIRRKLNVEEASKGTALGLISTMAIRNGLHRVPYLSGNGDSLYAEFERRFQFEPTEDQLTCFRAVEEDMVNKTRPMDRLICGDVGFGKTEVAIRAIFRAVLSNRQVALLAPTRILALQHARVLKNRMPDANIQLLRGGGKSQSVKDELKSGECQVVVGTHALLSPSVSFDNLGLLIIDEEQRFGVHHKEKLKALSSGTDVLTLSATPIPRTLQMSLSGLRDMSLMNSPPKGRKEVVTKVGRLSDADLVAAIKGEVERGGQVFVVCPLIEQVMTEFDRLEALLASTLSPNRICMAHGRMEDLEQRIDQFATRKFDVLVATTVIESGIDMPNVNTMIVLYAERFGIAQLYQLRGRVGRSDRQAFAYFCPNSTSLSVEAEQRLEYINTFTALGSGYDLSRRDMEMRGHGTIFGSEQSGARDVGLDLQSEILAEAVEQLRKDSVIGAAETRLALNTKLEALGKGVAGPLPETSDLMGVSRWEGRLASALLLKWLGTSDESNDVARRFLTAASGAKELRALLTQLKSKHKRIPTLVGDLFTRAIVRALARKIGAEEIRASEEDETKVVITMPQMSVVKWHRLLDSAVPEALRPMTAFSEFSDSERQTEGGQLILTVDEPVVKDGHGTIPADVLKLLLALAAEVDKHFKGNIKSLKEAEAEEDKVSL